MNTVCENAASFDELAKEVEIFPRNLQGRCSALPPGAEREFVQLCLEYYQTVRSV